MEEDFLREAISILRKVHSRGSLRRVCSEILQGAVLNSQSEYGSFVRIDEEGSRLRIEATSGKSWTTERSQLELKVGDGITGRVAKTGETYCSNDVSSDPNYICVLSEVSSELAIPVKVAGEVWGIINLDSDERDHYDASCILRMELLAEMVASAIEFRVQMDRERELSKSLIEAEKHSQMGYLVAGIAHEVNNPLASILGCAELLLDAEGEREDEKEIQVIAAQARRAGDIVKQLLAFSRRDTGENWETVSIEDVVQEVKELVAPSLRVAGVSLQVSLQNELLQGKLNRVQIQQILVNLVTNATQAILENRISDGLIRITARRVSDTLEIAVADNGLGLLSGVEGQIFDPFFTTKEKGRGTGLGLSIALEIAHAHEGDLACHSRPGQGCTFTLTLPVFESDTEERESIIPVAEVADSNARPRLLIVDDEAPIRWMLKKLLHPMTEVLFDAPDAEAGSNFADDNDFEVIISDFHLPGMDGIEFYERVRKPNLKQFVLITGDSSSPRVQSFSEREGVVVLEKPFDLNNVITLIRGSSEVDDSLSERVVLSG